MLTGSSTVARVDKAQTSDKQIADLFTLGQLPDPNQNNTWYRFNDSDTAVVFIHGVLSNSRTCWLNESDASGERCYWPELLAADDRFGKPAIYLGNQRVGRTQPTTIVGQAEDPVYLPFNRRYCCPLFSDAL